MSDLSRDIASLKGHYLSLFHLNARSLRNKFDEVNLFLSELNQCFDIICFSETWFSSDECVQLAGYDCVSACRSRKAGGGVAIYIRSELSYKIVPDYKIIDDNVECIVIQCCDILFALMYRPPSGSVNDFLHFSETLLEQSMELNLQVVLVGDLNIMLPRTMYHICVFKRYLNLMVSQTQYLNQLELPRLLRQPSTSVLQIFLLRI